MLFLLSVCVGRLASRMDTFSYSVLKYDTEVNMDFLTSVILKGPPLRVFYLSLWTECVLTGRYPINIKKNGNS